MGAWWDTWFLGCVLFRFQGYFRFRRRAGPTHGNATKRKRNRAPPCRCPQGRSTDNTVNQRHPARTEDRDMAPATAARLITVGHSPDPDDAFMFYALAHDKI